MPKPRDVVIVGAGAAGLAAARELLRYGLDVLILEARGRAGGRIFTRRTPHSPAPIELGAEFVHGDAPLTARILRAAAVVAQDIAGEHWAARGGRIVRAEYWEPVDRVMRLIDTRGPDESFSDFLARKPGGRRLAHDRAVARRFVEGFHAADLERIGARSIAPGEVGSASASASTLARIVSGYASVIAALERGLRPKLRLGACVEHVRWRRGRAEIVARTRGRRTRVPARAILMTVPLGVLKASAGKKGAIVFDPEPAGLRRALHGLEMGHVVRVNLRLRVPLGEALGPRAGGASLERLAFLHPPDRGPFHAWWTSYPLRDRAAVAWSGGVAAQDLLRSGEPAIVAQALAQLGAGSGLSARRLASLVEHVDLHDWSRDPYARGAYSYAAVGGSGAARALARPVDGTLFFAGEATHETRSGTVEGAIDSGLRAARRIRAALGR